MSAPVVKFVGRDCELSTTGIDGRGQAIPSWTVAQRVLGAIDTAFVRVGGNVWRRRTRRDSSWSRGDHWGGSYASASSTDCLRQWPSNGQCYYSDMAHVEVCTAETHRPCEVAAQSWSTLVVAEAARQQAQEDAEAGTRYLLTAANVDLLDPSISWGSHFNISIAPQLFDDLIVDPRHPGVLGFVTSAIAAAVPFFGSGYLLPLRDGSVVFSLSARAHHLSRVCGLSTTEAFSRGLLNARREPHAQGIDRLHLIGFDFALVSSALMTSFVQCCLAAAEVGYGQLLLASPVEALRAWSLGLDLESGRLRGTAPLADGRQVTLGAYVAEIAQAMLRLVEEGVIQDAVAPCAAQLLPRIVELAQRADRGDIAACSRHLDWAAKLMVLLGHCERTGEGLESSAVRLLDHDFTNTDPTRGAIWRLLEHDRIDPLIDRAQIDACLRDGPEASRSWTRGRLIKRFADDIEAVDWDHVELSLTDERFGRRLRVDMPHPGRLGRAVAEHALGAAREVMDLASLSDADDTVHTTHPLQDLRPELSRPSETCCSPRTRPTRGTHHE